MSVGSWGGRSYARPTRNTRSAMRDGVCPRCEGTEVYGAANGLAIGDDTMTAVHAHIEPGFRGMRPRARTQLHQFACASCGLLELHLLDPAGIDFIRANWVRVVGRPPAG